MNRTNTLRPEFVEFVPGTLQDGILYVSRKYKTASHLCCCGCGNKVVTPLNPSGWKLTEKRGAVTLHPSIGNWSFPCQSHYWIRGSRIEWAPRWSEREIEEGRVRDQVDRQHHFDASPGVAPKSTLWQRFIDWFKSVFLGWGA